MANLIFKNAETARDAIVASQQKEIAELYKKWADEIGEKAKRYAYANTASSVVAERQMRELRKMLTNSGKQLSSEIESKIKSNMYLVADEVVKSNTAWLAKFGFSEEGLNAAFNSVPTQVVQRLVTGQIYESGWSLSKRIWGDNDATMKDIYQIMAKGMAENKPIYEIAKELQSYVNPSAKKPWNPLLAMKNTQTGKIEYRRLYKSTVDYNAQRLARTLVQHSYQQSFIAVTQKNPFVLNYVWHSNGSRPCPLCQDRDGQVFAKGDLPMDHPNGQCTMEPVIADDMVNQLADWFNSPDGTYPDIDAFAGNFGYNAKLNADNKKEIKNQVDAKPRKESVAKSLAAKDGINLKNVSIREASDSWFEFEEASAMKQYIRDGVLKTVDDFGIMRTQEEVDTLKEYALKLQEAAEKTITEYKRVYRGTVIQDADAGEVREIFRKGNTFTFDSLTATSPDKGIASIYTNTENFGEGTPVIFEIESPKGIKGFVRDEGEVLIAKGEEYKITRQYFDEDDGMIHITLYKKK